MRKFILTAMTALLTASPALAAEKQHMHSHVSKSAKIEKHGCANYSFDAVMEKMHKGMNITYTGNSDLDFVVGMIPHHQGAVDMAKIELQYGRDPKMKWLARWIIQAQITEIGFMEGWKRGRLNDAAPKSNTPEVAKYKAVMDKMHHDMMVGYTGDVDVDFARGMIPHHQGAIDMAEIILKTGQNQEIKKLATDIINSQSQEIGIMKRWLATQAIPAPAATEHKTKAKSHH